MTQQFATKPYPLGARLGSGTLGRVHLTRDPRGDAVALKALYSDLAEVDSVRTAFLEAARRASRVQHPNIVEIIDVGEETSARGNSAFVVTRHHQAPNFAEELREHELSVEAVCEVGAQLCLALAAAHEQGLLHLDLKPENILIEWTAAGTPVARILDFGLAHAVFSHDGAPRASRWAHTPPRHQAPEVLLGQRARACSDVYSVGSILYEALAQMPPIIEEDEHSALHAVVCGLWKPLIQHNAQLPESLVRAIENALANDPDERMQSPLTLLRQLMLHIDEDSPIYARAQRELARSSDSGHFATETPSLMLQRAPKPRQIAEVPSSRLLSPVFPKSPLAPRIGEATKLRRQGDLEFGQPLVPEGGHAVRAQDHRLDLLAVFAGLLAGIALAWLNVMR